VEKISYLGETILRWKVGPSTFLALPERGARLMNWNFELGDGSVRDVLYWPELENLNEFHRIRGGNPILFPFSGRTFDQGEINFWRAPDGERRTMPQHGIARQGTFKITRLDARGFSAQLIPDTAAQEAYPFDYEFIVNYRFDALSLSCEFTLQNLGKVPLPWSAGHHFYFTLPWSEGTRSDYVIRFPSTETLRQNSTGALIPGPKLKAEETLSNPDLLDTIQTRLGSNEVRFGERAKPGYVSVHLGTRRTPPADAAFVTWTADEKAPYFCVEPWMGPPNAPEHKRGLEWVRPGEKGVFSVTVAVK
jgi:galactose mutarotase-like enzyme